MVIPLRNQFDPLGGDSAAAPVTRVEDPRWNQPASSTSALWASFLSSYKRTQQIDTPLGLDTGHSDGWCWADHHAGQSCRIPHEYPVRYIQDSRHAEYGMVDFPVLLQALHLKAAE